MRIDCSLISLLMLTTSLLSVFVAPASGSAIASPILSQSNSLEARKAEAERLVSQAMLQWSTDSAMAIQLLQQGLTIYREIGDRDQERQTLTVLGFLYLFLGQPQQATALYQQAVELDQQLLNTAHASGDELAEASLWLRLGQTYRILNQPQSATDAYQQAIALYQRQINVARDGGDRQQELWVLGDLSEIYRQLDQIQPFIEMEQQRLSLARELGDGSVERVSLSNLADIYPRLGQYQQAIEAGQQSLELAKAENSSPQEILALMRLGNLYRLLGQDQKFEEMMQQAGELRAEASRSEMAEASRSARAGSSVPVEAVSFMGLSSIECLQKMLSIIRRSTSETSSCSLPPALTGFLSFFPSFFHEYYERSVLERLGDAYEAQAEYPPAIESLQQALELVRRQVDREVELKLLTQLGGLLAKQQQPELAILFFKQSVNLTESIRKNIRGLPPAFQQSYTEKVSDTYRRLADLLLQQNRGLEAQQVSDLLKVEELDNSLPDARGNELTGQGVAYLPAEQQILDRYDQAIAQRLTADSQQPTQDFNGFINSPEVRSLVEQVRRPTRLPN